MSTDGIALLSQAMGSLPPAERRVAQWLVDNRSEAVSMSITSLAAAAKSSTAAVVRLCKRLGVEGFQDLKLQIALSSSHEPHDEGHGRVTIDDIDTSDDIMNSVVGRSIEVLELIPKVLSSESLEHAAQLLYGADQVIICGQGASAVVALDLQQKLQRLRRRVSFSMDPDMQVVSACGLGSGDLCFGISYSGRNRFVEHACRVAGENGASVITLTRFGRNPVSSLATASLGVPALEPLVRQAASISRIAQLTVVDLLFASLVSFSSDTARIDLQRTSDVLREPGR